MNQVVIDAQALSDALLAIEDAYLWDATAALRTAADVEARATELGAELLIHRARLCQVNMLMRAGDLTGAASRIFAIERWAAEHGETQLRARVHLIWANIYRLLGDPARCLENSVTAVELLDDTATPHMQVWHRAKLADSLGLSGSTDAARLRYEQTEELCHQMGQPRLLMGMLNNWAYTEFQSHHPEMAQKVARRLQTLAADHGFELDPAVLDTIGSIQIENGEFAAAERTLTECIERHSAGRHEDADALAEYLLTLARAQRGLGAIDRAQANLDASRRLCAERELADVRVRVLQEQSELFAARGEFAAAFSEHKEFFAAYNRLHDGQREAQARTRQAMFETAEAREEAERFREQARRDPLTGLRNRRYVDEQAPRLIAGDGPLSMAIIDLDHFKRINDLLSHDVGDQVLVQVAALLESALATRAPSGFVARLGGEEFVAVLPGLTAPHAAALLDEVRRIVGRHSWSAITRGLPVTVSIGVADLTETERRTQAGLLSTADRNLYAAKHAGRDRVVSGASADTRWRTHGGEAPAA